MLIANPEHVEKYDLGFITRYWFHIIDKYI